VLVSYSSYAPNRMEWLSPELRCIILLLCITVGTCACVYVVGG